jgi:chromatin remodeling complex protein RSC6
MAKISIAKSDLEIVVELANRAAKRTQSKVVIASEMLDVVDDEREVASSTISSPTDRSYDFR